MSVRNPARRATGSKSQDNLALYEHSYGQREAVSDFIPFMISTFLESDRNFTRSRQSK